MIYNSITQGDIYSFLEEESHVEVLKPDGKKWYIPKNDILMLTDKMNKIEKLRKLEQEISVLREEIIKSK